MYLLTYILGFFATFMSLIMLNYNSKPGEEMSMPAAVISSIIWPVSMFIGLTVGVFKGISSVYNHFAK